MTQYGQQQLLKSTKSRIKKHLKDQQSEIEKLAELFPFESIPKSAELPEELIEAAMTCAAFVLAEFLAEDQA